MTYREHDPEVAADIARREESTRDPKRKGCAYDWTRPVVVTRWPCLSGCGAMVDVTDAEVAAIDQGNAKMLARGFAPLPVNERVRCQRCRDAHERRLVEARAAALEPRQTEITTTDPLAAYKPTPRAQLPRGPRKLR